MKYELSFLTKNIPLEKKEEIVNLVESEIKKLGGLVEEKFSEKKNFAYPVKKEKDGYLAIFSFSLSPDKIENLKKVIVSEKNILREMIERKAKEEKTKPVRTKKTPERKYEIKKPIEKKKKAKIEDLDEKLKEILK